MKLCYLSNDPNKPCFVLISEKVTVMIDCGMSYDTLMKFLPIHDKKMKFIKKVTTWTIPKVQIQGLKGELKQVCENGDVFVNSTPEFLVPTFSKVNFDTLDYIAISNYHAILALPFIIDSSTFQGRIMLTEHTLVFGKLMLEELATFINKLPKRNFATQWKNFISQLPYPLNNSYAPKSWKQIYSLDNVEKCFRNVLILRNDSEIYCFRNMVVRAVDSEYCAGSCNWVFTIMEVKIVYIGGTPSRGRTRPQKDYPFHTSNLFIMANLIRNTISDPDFNYGFLAGLIEVTVNSGGNVLIPCLSNCFTYSLFEVIATYLHEKKINVPMIYVSPVAEKTLRDFKDCISRYKSYYIMNTKKKTLRISPENELKLVHASSMEVAVFKKHYRTPCIMFCGHPSLRFGEVVHFMDMWGNDSRNVLLLAEPDFDHKDAVAPYQPLKMFVQHCPVDTRLHYRDANQMIRTYNPENVVAPLPYLKPPADFPDQEDMKIEADPSYRLIGLNRNDIMHFEAVTINNGNETKKE